jgi:hypothetical protein
MIGQVHKATTKIMQLQLERAAAPDTAAERLASALISGGGPGAKPAPAAAGPAAQAPPAAAAAGGLPVYRVGSALYVMVDDKLYPAEAVAAAPAAAAPAAAAPAAAVARGTAVEELESD